MSETNEQAILRRAQGQALTKIAELVLPWMLPNSLRNNGITTLEIKNLNVQSIHARISRENNRLIIEVMPRQREPNSEVAVIAPEQSLVMPLIEDDTPEVEGTEDGPSERQDISLPLH